VSALVVLLIFFFMGRNLHANWSRLSEYSWDFNYGLLVASIGMVAVLNSLIAIGWLAILKQLGVHLGFWKGLRINLLSQLGKYLPGKVWMVVGKVILAGREGKPRKPVFASTVFENAFATVSGLFLSVVFVAASGTTKFYYLLGPAVVCIVAGLIAVHPAVFQRIANYVLKKVKRSPITVTMKYRTVLALLAYYFCYWLVMGVAFYLFFSSIYPLSPTLIFDVAGIVAISALAGFFALITPGGLGVREGVMVVLLTAYVPVPVAVILSFGHRIWLTLSELALAGIVAAAVKPGNAAPAEQVPPISDSPEEPAS
jgi:uncharacterized membrane protein YbhN (UPF0104 family)